MIPDPSRVMIPDLSKVTVPDPLGGGGIVVPDFLGVEVSDPSGVWYRVGPGCDVVVPGPWRVVVPDASKIMVPNPWGVVGALVLWYRTRRGCAVGPDGRYGTEPV